MTMTEPAGPIGTAPFTTEPLSDERLAVLVEVLRRHLADDQILLAKTDRFNRARVPAPFPVHRWSERVPDVVVMPRTTEEVSAVVRIANELRIPVVPRDGGTGLTDCNTPVLYSGPLSLLTTLTEPLPPANRA